MSMSGRSDSTIFDEGSLVSRNTGRVRVPVFEGTLGSIIFQNSETGEWITIPPRWQTSGPRSPPPRQPTPLPDFLANTSLDPSLNEPDLPPFERPLSRRSRQRRDAIEEFRREVVRLEARANRERQDREARKFFDRLSWRRYEELHALRSKLPGLQGEYMENWTRFERENTDAYVQFIDHMNDSFAASPVNVRRFDMIKWFGKLPTYLIEPLCNLSRYYHQEVWLRLQMHRAEQAASGNQPGNDIHSEEDYACDNTNVGWPDFGFETTGNRIAFETYDPVSNYPGEPGPGEPEETDDENDEEAEETAEETAKEPLGKLAHVLANFKVRVIRLLHADSSVRYPYRTRWDETLDYSLSKFIMSALNYIYKHEYDSDVDRADVSAKKNLLMQAVQVLTERHGRLDELSEQLGVLKSAEAALVADLEKAGRPTVRPFATDSRLLQMRAEIFRTEMRLDEWTTFTMPLRQ